MATRTEKQGAQRRTSETREIERLRREVDNLKEVVTQLQTAVQSLSSKRVAAEVVEAEPDGEEGLAKLPEPDADGYYPAIETVRAILARQITTRRRKAGLSQAELAERAGIRQETLRRLESGQYSSSVATVDKIDRALSEGEV